MDRYRLKKLLRPLVPWLYRANQLRWYITRPITLGVRLLLISEQRVLLVRHTYQEHWYLPGGGVKRGETLEEAARREAKEEVGAELGELHLFGTYTNFYDHKNDHVIVFRCHDFTFSGQGDFEIAAVEQHPLNQLPEDISPGSRHRIQEYQEGKQNENFGIW